MKLVTLEQASAHIRRDTDADDADLSLKIEIASAMIMEYLADSAESFTDSAGDLIEGTDGVAQDVPVIVQGATLLLIEHLYKNRDGATQNVVPAQYGFGYLPHGVIMLLYPIRRPSIA